MPVRRTSLPVAAPPSFLLRPASASIRASWLVLLLLAALMGGFASRSLTSPVSASVSLAPDGIDPASPERAGSRIVWLPSGASPEGATDCELGLVAQNLGHESNKVTIISWGESGECPPQAAGPLKVECSGLIAPGGTWRFASAQIPAGTHSLLAVSFSADRLSRIGVDLGFDDIVADLMCETLFFGVVGDADDFGRFLAAYRTGADFAGVPMERAAGAPIAVQLQRDCPSADDVPHPRVSAVAGIFEAELGAPDAEGSFHYALPLAHASPITSTGTALHIQNVGDGGCANVEVVFRAEDLPDAEPCTLSVPSLATGETVQLDLAACADDVPLRGSALVRGSQPLAITSDLRWGEAMLSVPATAFTPREEEGGGGGTAAPASVHTALSAPVVYYEVGGWTSHVHVQNTDLAEGAEVRMVLQGRASEDRSFSVVVPPAGSRAIDLGGLIGDGMTPRNWVGSLRLISEAADEGDAAPGIAAVVASYRNLEGEGPSESWGYTATSLPARATAPARSSARGGLLAVPSLVKADGGTGATTELAIANGASGGGGTDLVLFIFDANGLLDYVCQRLGAGMVEHIDFATWGAINGGFRGSAVVSATVWERGPEGDASAQLSAVVTHRPPWTGGEATLDEAGDSSFAHAAIAIPESANAGFVPGAIVNRFDVCGRTIVVHTPTPWPTLTPVVTPTQPAPAETPTPAVDDPNPRMRLIYMPRAVR